MGTKNNPGKFDCFANADPDEPMFILLARDPHAAPLVRMWAALRNGHHADAAEAFAEALRVDKRSSIDKTLEASQCALSMAYWRSYWVNPAED